MALRGRESLKHYTSALCWGFQPPPPNPPDSVTTCGHSTFRRPCCWSLDSLRTWRTMLLCFFLRLPAHPSFEMFFFLGAVKNHAPFEMTPP